MNRFEEDLPKHFVVFSQTPKAQEQSRRLFIRFGAFLATPVLGMVVFQNAIMSVFFACIFVLIMSIGWRQWKRWQQIPFAVNSSHPMMELDFDKEAEVMIRLHDGRWVKAGNERYRLNSDDLLS